MCHDCRCRHSCQQVSNTKKINGCHFISLINYWAIACVTLQENIEPVTSMLSFSEHFPLPAMYIIIQPRTCKSFSEVTRLPLLPTVPAEANLAVFLEEPEILCHLLKFRVIIDHQNCRTTWFPNWQGVHKADSSWHFSEEKGDSITKFQAPKYIVLKTHCCLSLIQCYSCNVLTLWIFNLKYTSCKLKQNKIQNLCPWWLLIPQDAWFIQQSVILLPERPASLTHKIPKGTK